MDRSAASQALSKIIAYLNVGKDKDAQVWWDKLKSMAAKEGLK